MALRTRDHADAVARVVSDVRALRPLPGPVPAACWEPGLAPAIEACGAEIEEELVLDLLLEDLARVAPDHR